MKSVNKSINFESVKLRRDISVDCVKGLAIIAVVLGHLGFNLPSIPENNIYLAPILYSLWYVPVFFCIAGFFIKEDRLANSIEFIKKKAKTLYLKTIIFVGIAVLCHNLFLKTGLYSEQLDYVGKTMSFYSIKDIFFTLIKTIFFMGREPITGPLWFGYVLFMALCGYSLIAYVLNKFLQYEHQNMFIIRGVVILALTIVSNILSQNFGITQNRLSNIFPAMLLIYIGQYFNEEKRLNFDSPIAALTCFLLILQAALRSGGISLNNNQFYDVFHLVAGGGATTYFLIFLFKKIKVSVFKQGLAFLGNYSFSIMGLHMLLFKPCMIVWNHFFHTSFDIAALVPGIGTNYIAGIFFLVLSCFVPALLGFILEKKVMIFLKKR